MAEPVSLSHPSGLRETAYQGWSWTSFFFGGLPALFRGDITGFLACGGTAIVLGGVTFGLGLIPLWFIWAAIYNHWHLKRLLEKGYSIASQSARGQFTTTEGKIGLSPKAATYAIIANCALFIIPAGIGASILASRGPQQTQQAAPASSHTIHPEQLTGIKSIHECPTRFAGDQILIDQCIRLFQQKDKDDDLIKAQKDAEITQRMIDDIRRDNEYVEMVRRGQSGQRAARAAGYQ